jgi:hypothetical protein
LVEITSLSAVKLKILSDSEYESKSKLIELSDGIDIVSGSLSSITG